MRNIIILLLLSSIHGYSQNTIATSLEGPSPKADLNAISWMQGHWRGEAFGGITEEIWAPPLGGSMMFSFKLVSHGEVRFYELGHIREVDGTLVYELKHFNADMTAWEEKDEVRSFKLIKAEKGKVYFEGFTFENLGEDEINIYALIGQEKGEAEEVKFNFKRF